MSRTFEHLVGHRFPGGAYGLPAYVSWLWTDAVGGTPDPDVAHPSIAYMVGLHGGRASIGDVFALFETDATAGVLFGELAFEFHDALRPGATYDVQGEVVAVERKLGRRTGPFDRVTFQHRLASPGGDEAVSTITHTWVIPRGGEA